MYKLSDYEKNELRRLTQKANRRLKAFQEAYERDGYSVIPKEVTAGFDIQTSKQWNTKSYALSRSTKFDSKREFQQRMRMLRRFDSNKADSVPTVSEYVDINQKKLKRAFETSGVKVDKKMLAKIGKMNSVEISKFWADYRRRADRKGMQYSSESVMAEMLDSYTTKDKGALMKSILK